MPTNTYYSPFFPAAEVVGAKGTTIAAVPSERVQNLDTSITQIKQDVQKLEDGGFLDSTPPAAVSNVTAVSSISDAGADVTVSYTAPSDSDLAGYDISAREGSGGSWIDFATTSTSYSFRALKRNQLYSFRVRAYDKAGNRGPWSSVVDHTTARDNVPPAKPTNVAVETSFTTASIRWLNGNESDLSYANIYLYSADGTTLLDSSRKVSAAKGSGSYIWAGLAKATTYRVAVELFDTSNNGSGASTQVTFTMAGGVNYADFTPGLEPIQTVTALPATSGYSGPKVVFFNGKIYRLVNGSWTKEVDNSDLANNSVNSDKLADNSVLASKINATFGGGNLVRNSSFDNGSWQTGSGPVANGFFPYNNTASDPTIYDVQLAGRRGGYAQLVQWTAGQSTTKGIYLENTNGVNNTLIFKANTTYVLSFYAKGSHPAPAGISLRWNVQPTVVTPLSYPTLSGEWQRWVFRIKFGASSDGNGFITTDYTGASSGFFYIDDLQVEEGEIATAYSPALLSGEITSDLIKDGTVGEVELAVGAVTANKIASRQIAAGHIVSGTITANELAADSVTANKILANSITAEKIVIGSRGQNLVSNPNGADGTLAGWYFNEGEGAPNVVFSVGDFYVTGKKSIVISKNAVGTATNLVNRAFPVVPGKTYVMRMKVSATDGSSATGLYIRVNYGNSVDANGIVGSAIRSGLFDFVASGRIDGAIHSFELPWTCPVGVSYASLAIYNWSGAPKTILYSDMELFEQTTTGVIADGAITVDKLAADSVTANKIKAGTITAAQIAAGAITANKLLIANTNFLNPDPGFRDTEFWYNTGVYEGPLGTNAGSAGGSWYNRHGADIDEALGTKQYVMLGEAYSPGNLRAHLASRVSNTIIGNKTYQFSASCRNASNQNVYIYVRYYDVSGNFILDQELAWTPGDIRHKSRQITAPSNANSWHFLIFNQSGFNFLGNCQVYDLQLVEAVGSTAILPGAITTEKITVGTLNGDRIQVGTLSADRIAANSVISSTVTVQGNSLGAISDRAYDGMGYIEDTRDSNFPPSYYYAKGTRTVLEFKNVATVGVPQTGPFAPYGTMTTLVQWANDSGGPVQQTFVNSAGQTFTRYSVSNSSWGAWKDAAANVNQAFTQVDPGRVLISGATSLSNWRAGGDNTKIEGGNIFANSIKANSLQIGSRGISTQDLVFRYNAADQGCYWGGGAIFWIDDAGNSQVTGIPGGVVGKPPAGSYTYIYWVKGVAALYANTDYQQAIGSDRIHIATHNGSPNINQLYGGTIINGTEINTGSITADRLNVGSLSAITANIGLLRTATSGARTEIESNQIRVYDGNGTLRVRMGLW